MTMLALRLADDTIAQIDALVANGWSINRTVFVRDAIEAALARTAETMLDRQLATALDRLEESDEEIESLKASTRGWVSSLPDEDW